jgi:uncharacterized membrane protein
MEIVMSLIRSVLRKLRSNSRPTVASPTAVALLLLAVGGCGSDQAPTAPVLPVQVAGVRNEVAADAFTTIDPPGSDGKFTNPLDINARGDIVGLYNSAPDGHRHGFLRNAEGVYKIIDFPGSTATNADGINPRGDIVGHAVVSGKRHGYLRKKNGQFTQIDVPGASVSLAIGINPRGDIVGFYCSTTPPACSAVPGNRTARGFLLHKGKFTTIQFPGALETRAFKINRRDQIVGGYLDANAKSHLFLLSEGKFMTIDFPGAFETIGGQAGINPQGDIVSIYCDAAPCKDANFHGFVLSDGEFTRIDVPGHIGTGATGINSRGDIVGYYDADATHFLGFLRRGRE